MSRAQKAVVGTIVAVAVLGVLIGIYFASGGKGGSEAETAAPRERGETRFLCAAARRCAASARQEKNSVQTLDLMVCFI